MDDDAGDIGLAIAYEHTAFSSPRSSARTRRPVPLPIHIRRASLTSPSSPDLSERQIRPQLPLSPDRLSRSRTLPRLRPKSPLPQELVALTWDAPDLDVEVVTKLRRWIACVVLVNFDLDLGPVVYGVYPPFELSPSEKENIAFSSLPDSFQFDEGSQVHSFRIRESLSVENQAPKRKSASQDGFLYGFAQFTQRREPRLKRGYEQRSVVILTHNPWPALFSELAARLGPMYLKHGNPMLEAACHNIANWKDPGATLELGFLGSVLNVELPDNAEQQQLTETSSFQEKYDPSLHILASMAPPSPPAIALFAASISHLWSIWECLLLCEPLLIFGTSPPMTSQAVWWLRDILRPIPYAGDCRPYFTIHDKDCASLVNKNPPKAGLMLGVTNPFFASTCKHWPHILSLGRESRDSKHGGGKQSDIIIGPAPGWKTKTHNRYISKDKELLGQMENAVKKPPSADAEVQLSLLMRRHFSTRTSAFLVPLNRYVTTLIPTPSEVSALQSSTSRLFLHTQPSPSLRPFNHVHFFESLKARGSPLPFRSTSKQKDFYERWLKSPSFGLWLARQEEIVGDILKKKAEPLPNSGPSKGKQNHTTGHLP